MTIEVNFAELSAFALKQNHNSTKALLFFEGYLPTGDLIFKLFLQDTVVSVYWSKRKT